MRKPGPRNEQSTILVKGRDLHDVPHVSLLTRFSRAELLIPVEALREVNMPQIKPLRLVSCTLM